MLRLRNPSLQSREGSDRSVVADCLPDNDPSAPGHYMTDQFPIPPAYPIDYTPYFCNCRNMELISWSNRTATLPSCGINLQRRHSSEDSLLTNAVPDKLKKQTPDACLLCSLEALDDE